ncbi:MAG TPA: hypothetical protein DIV79_15305 [Opitutae bacterium]|nr:hypothetical protein [Opitutaceae bacterium]HCR31372.1 hypothetical protein [Opitutae bacterium]
MDLAFRVLKEASDFHKAVASRERKLSDLIFSVPPTCEDSRYVKLCSDIGFSEGTLVHEGIGSAMYD